MTGSEEHHSDYRTMVVDHMRKNISNYSWMFESPAEE